MLSVGVNICVFLLTILLLVPAQHVLQIGKYILEPSLQAVLIRLIHSLLPHVGNLVKGTNLLAQFTTMTISVVEVSEKHPAVVREALAFFYSLAGVDEDISTQISSVSAPNASCYFSMFTAILEPNSTSFQAGNNGLNDLFSESYSCQWGALKCLNLIIRSLNATESQEFIDAKSSLLRCRAFALLEVFHGSNSFRSSAKYKGVAAPRISECCGVPLNLVLNEVFSVIEGLLYLQIYHSRPQADSALLHWLLFSRMLITGVANKYVGIAEAETESLTVSSVVKRANYAAAVEAREILSYICPSRWQVKMEGSHIGQLALSAISRTLEGQLSKSPHFNPLSAREVVSVKCRDFNSSSRGVEHIPESYASLHLEDMVSAACNLSTATSDQAELPSLQVEGLRLLSIIIRLYCEATDPESNGGDKNKVLSQYSSQIVSCVRHALNEPSCSSSMELYLGGCEAALLVLETSLINDVVVLRRLLRPILPTDLNLSFGSYPTCEEDVGKFGFRPKASNDYCADLQLFSRISRIGSFSQIRIYVDLGVYQGDMRSHIFSETTPMELCLAVHAAALAIDAFRIFYGNRRATKVSSSDQLDECDSAIAPQTEFDKGLCFANVGDLSNETKMAFNGMAPRLASFAVTCFAAYLRDSGKEDGKADESEIKVACKDWLLNLLPLLFTGIRHALQHFANNGDRACNISMGLSAQETVVLYVYGLRMSLSYLSAFGDEASILEELDALVSDLTDFVHVPCISDCPIGIATKELVVQTCGLISDLCSAASFKLKCLTRAIFAPLAAFQSHQEQSADVNDICSQVLSTCLRAVQPALANTESGELDFLQDKSKLVMSLIDVCLKVLFLTGEGKCPSLQLKEAACSLLAVCLSSPSVSDEEKRSICVVMASSGNWKGWAFICRNLQDGSGLQCSLEVVKES